MDRLETKIKELKKEKNAIILAHCYQNIEIDSVADFVGSTKEIMDYIKYSQDKEFVIATEKGVLDSLQRDYSDKIFHLIKETIVCQNMKWHTLEDIYYSLKNETHEITLDETTARKATRCIERMFE